MNYISKYSNGKEVTAAQYITELICENKAKIQNKDLHFRFWTNKIWARFYRDQIATANKLVKKYNETAIIKALKSDVGRKIYSLRAPHLISMIEHETSLLDQMNNTLSKEYDRSSNKTFRNTQSNSIISKLKDIE